MLPISKDEVEIGAVDIDLYTENDGCNELVISWNSNIGWGEYTIVKRTDSSTSPVYFGYSEHMDNNNDKWFIKKLMEKFIDDLEIKS